MLQVLSATETGLYLSGGTAASRGYLQHRFSEDLDLFVNDEITLHPQLGRLDSPENILANKLTALADRDEPKDLADIWGFCCRLGLPLSRALDDASSKAAGLFPPALARGLLSASRADWELIRWIEAPDPDAFLADLRRLGEELALLPPPR